MTDLNANLPALRQDLQLFEGPEGVDGSRTWAIYDPIRNRHFKIGAKAFAMLSRWQQGTIEAIRQQAKSVAGISFSEKDFENVMKFLAANSLIEVSKKPDVEKLLTQYKTASERNLAWVGRNLFFFRLPILRAERLLKFLAKASEPLYSRKFFYLILVLGIVGFYLVARQLDSFLTSFEYFFTWQGGMLFVASLALLKVFHEFAHGITATRFGAHVSNMGVAFMVFFPVLYTDVSDSWRIRSRRQRLLVGAAGIIAELYIALSCTFLWSFLPDGSYRSAAFFLATTSWIWTLAINVNPFMKFDGYYLLSDYWGVENLQKRAFSLGRWQLRELLFDIRHPIPDALTTRKTKQLIAYAWLTWLYRVILFFSISYFLLSSFFKLAAIILLSVSAYKFIGKPVIDELKTWYELRGSIKKSPRSYITLLALVLSLVVLFMPWFSTVLAPGVMLAEQKTIIYPQRPAQISKVMVERGQLVEKGDLLFSLVEPALMEEAKLTAKRKALIKLKLDRRAASAIDRANLMILNQELAEQQTRLLGLEREIEKLNIAAPFAGQIVNLNSELHVGRWVDTSFELTQLVQNETAAIEAVIQEHSLDRIKVGDKAVFVPDELELADVAATVVSIEQANLRELHIPYLESTYGGAIAVRADKQGSSVPEKSIFRVVLLLDEPAGFKERVVRGVARINGTGTSLAGRIYRRVAAVFIRESGF